MFIRFSLSVFPLVKEFIQEGNSTERLDKRSEGVGFRVETPLPFFDNENQATNAFSLTTELALPKYGVEEKKRDPRNQDSVQSQRRKDSSALSYWSFFKPSHSR
jgi:hypothetical protein